MELPFHVELNVLCPYAIIICKLLSYYYMCVILITVVIGTKVINALPHLLSSLVTEKYLHYSIDITTEQILDIRMELTDAKIRIFKNVS